MTLLDSCTSYWLLSRARPCGWGHLCRVRVPCHRSEAWRAVRPGAACEGGAGGVGQAWWCPS